MLVLFDAGLVLGGVCEEKCLLMLLFCPMPFLFVDAVLFQCWVLLMLFCFDAGLF